MKVLFDNNTKFKQKLTREGREKTQKILGVVCYTAGGNNITLGM